MKRRCPACDSDAPTGVARIAASTIVDSNPTYRRDALEILGVLPATAFDIVRCDRCGFVYAHDLPDESFLSRVYCEVIDPTAAAAISRSPAWTGHQLRLAGALLERLGNRTRPKLLDYGCGDGTVLAALAAAGFACVGFDAYPRSSDAGVTISSSTPELHAAAPFDAVLLSDVLEHVANPRDVLRQCGELLAVGGWLCVNVPDFGESRLHAILRDLAAGAPITPELNPWEHLNYFSPDTLARMVGCAGFSIDVQPVPNFGIRSDARGFRRMTNAVRSLLRLVSFVAIRNHGITTAFAQKT